MDLPLPTVFVDLKFFFFSSIFKEFINISSLASLCPVSIKMTSPAESLQQWHLLCCLKVKLTPRQSH